MIEIERKFLVSDDSYKTEVHKSTNITQGYLNSHPERAVRIRIKGKKGFLTIKGKSNESGTSRFEWEKEISLEEAKALIKLCEEGIIEKVRHEVSSGKHIIEIDEFLGRHKGLVLAEIELSSEDEKFLKPTWLDKEVTGDPRYYNSQLSKDTRIP
ncbi:CYTH domain-containing protein [Aquimarina sp. 2201CG5-10]|uniref:CYTH domain-containing protein n=1 Tax=Aquimarina callyspongiae TaxID=3098150 RepID=UPI002AB4C54C|nr:CYTH domain-containing protein [Aquimarina sp. 2201CG5-10]MDY8137020.1 CYTH domain-containing protein [Aquimarina sp. 2201CG5-10]